MLSDLELVGMRATLTSALPDTCAVERLTSESDGGGGSTLTWGTHLADIVCRLAPVAGGEEGTPGGRIADESTHIVTLPAQTDIAEADRLVIDDQVYEVTLVRTRGRWEITRRVECVEAPDGTLPAPAGLLALTSLDDLTLLDEIGVA